MSTRKWLDAVSILLGLWLVVSFALAPQPESPAPMWLGILMGLAVVVLGGWSQATERPLAPEMLNVALGILLFLSPWLLSYTHMGFMAWDAWGSGFVLAGIELLAVQDAFVEHGPPHTP